MQRGVLVSLQPVAGAGEPLDTTSCLSGHGDELWRDGSTGARGAGALSAGARGAGRGGW